MGASMQALSTTAREPEIAVREEFELALTQGTVEAIDLFIARHPNSALAAAARERRCRLMEKAREPRQLMGVKPRT